MVYSIAERVEIVVLYTECGNSFRKAARIFNQKHPGKNVSHPYVRKLYTKFSSTGSVANSKRKATAPVANEENQTLILGNIANNHTLSLRKLEQSTGISRSTIQRILKKNKFHPYKLKLVQELYVNDSERRLQFCEIISEKVIQNPDLLYNICFSDECTFYLNGPINRQNVRYWADENPHWFREYHTVKPQKLNVWAGILGNHIVGPFFLEGNMNGVRYRQLLEDEIYPKIQDLVQADEDLNENLVTFQQDGAPPHCGESVSNFLNNQFPDGRWIGRHGEIKWPARSPDLTPLDFFLWGHLKSNIYKTQPRDLDDLRARIIDECQQLTPECFANVRRNFEQRLYFCMELNGGHFQQFLS